MIPEEVAQIAYLLRERYGYAGAAEDEFDYSVQVAWEIYNMMNQYHEAHLKGIY